MKTRAFTLVELLVVITIIGMLAALITAAGTAAVNAAKRAKIRSTMGEIEFALEMYKNKYGEYPPDFSDQKAVLRHVKKRWPRYNFGGATTELAQYNYFISQNRAAGGLHFETLSGEIMAPAQISSLPFWLGGLPNNAVDPSTNPTWATGNNYNWLSGFTHLIGFAANPENPFDVGTPTDRKAMEPPLMSFEVGKNLGMYGRTNGNSPADGNRRGMNLMLLINDSPVVYFRSKPSRGNLAYAMSEGGPTNITKSSTVSSGGTSLVGFSHRQTQKVEEMARMMPDGSLERFFPGSAVPYARAGTTSDPQWYNQDSYQLVHPGLDGIFGRITIVTPTQYIPQGRAPSIEYTGQVAILDGTNIGQFDLDNIVNFGDSGTIESLLP